jgi:hypothetical protein
LSAPAQGTLTVDAEVIHRHAAACGGRCAPFEVDPAVAPALAARVALLLAWCHLVRGPPGRQGLAAPRGEPLVDAQQLRPLPPDQCRPDLIRSVQSLGDPLLVDALPRLACGETGS